jgi:ATP-dependent protease HslVU peptidase subunit
VRAQERSRLHDGGRHGVDGIGHRQAERQEDTADTFQGRRGGRIQGEGRPRGRRRRRGGRGGGDGAEAVEEEAGKDDTIVGFAGATADAFTLLERLEGKLDEHPGQLARSCVELAKGWRTDKYLRRLEASLLVADRSQSFEITGNGDVLESHDGVLGVGSGSNFAMAAARALMDNPDLSAEDVARKAMQIGETTERRRRRRWAPARKKMGDEKFVFLGGALPFCVWWGSEGGLFPPNPERPPSRPSIRAPSRRVYITRFSRFY